MSFKKMSVSFAALLLLFASFAQVEAKETPDAQLKDIETRWSKALQTRDAAFVESILADDYVVTTEKGKVLNRSGAIKDVKTDTDAVEQTSNSNVMVHSIKSDAAVVTGMSRDVGKDKDGKKFDRTYRWTDTFVNRNGKWQCVATQITLVSQK
jgi:ketosteroid isomerase-like protein